MREFEEGKLFSYKNAAKLLRLLISLNRSTGQERAYQLVNALPSPYCFWPQTKHFVVCPIHSVFEKQPYLVSSTISSFNAWSLNSFNLLSKEDFLAINLQVNSFFPYPSLHRVFFLLLLWVITICISCDRRIWFDWSFDVGARRVSEKLAQTWAHTMVLTTNSTRLEKVGG